MPRICLNNTIWTVMINSCSCEKLCVIIIFPPKLNEVSFSAPTTIIILHLAPGKPAQQSFVDSLSFGPGWLDGQC